MRKSCLYSLLMKTLVTLFCILGSCNFLAAAAISASIVTNGPYTIVIYPSGSIKEISVNNVPILKRGTFFVYYNEKKDSQFSANTQDAKIDIHDKEGTKIISCSGKCKENGNNIEFIQRITFSSDGLIDIELKIKYLLDTVSKYPIQYELGFASPEIVYGQECEIITSDGQQKQGIFPESDFKNCKVLIDYFKTGWKPQKLIAQTKNNTLLGFEFPDASAMLYLSANGGLNWIMNPEGEVTPGAIVVFHFKVILSDKKK